MLKRVLSLVKIRQECANVIKVCPLTLLLRVGDDLGAKKFMWRVSKSLLSQTNDQNMQMRMLRKKKENKYSYVMVTNVNQPKTRPGQPTFESHHFTSLPSGPSNTCPQIVQLADRTFWQVFWIPSFVFSSFM